VIRGPTLRRSHAAPQAWHDPSVRSDNTRVIRDPRHEGHRIKGGAL